MGLNRYASNCDRATDYRVVGGEYYTNGSNITNHPNPIYKDIDARLNSAEDGVAAIVEWPGTSTAYDRVKSYNNTTGSGWDSDLLDGHHGSYYTSDGADDYEGRRLYGNVPTDSVTFAPAYVPANCDFDGTYWTFCTTKSGGYVCRLPHRDGFPSGGENKTYLPSGGLQVGYYVKDIKWHDGYYFVLMREVSDAVGAVLGKYDKDMVLQGSKKTITSFTNPVAMDFAGNALYIGGEGSPASAAVVYDLDSLDYITTDFALGNNECQCAWSDGLNINFGMAHVSHNTTETGGGCGVLTGYVLDPGGTPAWTMATNYHTSDFTDILDGGVFGPFSSYILHKTAAGGTRFVWQTREKMEEGTTLTLETTNYKTLDADAYRFAPIGQKRVVVGHRNTDQNGNAFVYEMMVNSTRDALVMSHIHTEDLGYVNDGHGVVDMEFGNGALFVVGLGSTTGPPSIYKDALLGGW